MPDTSDPAKPPRDEALAWFVRLNSGDATDNDRTRFAEWLRAGAENRAAYDRLEDVWADLDRVPDPRRARQPRRTALSRRTMLAGATGAAASAGFVMLASGITVHDIEGMLTADYRTGTGERRTITTPDGSTVELDACTSIALEFDANVRRLRLLSGRAMFTVAPDRTRPFEVACAGGTIRALGTAFAVHRRPTDTAVAVAESAVTVTVGTPETRGGTARVTQGQRITYGAAGLGRIVSAADGAETAWRRGKMIFRDRPLGDVVADLNRYRPGRIAIWDDALLNLHVDGVFNTASPEAALDAIVGTLPVQGVRLTPYLVILRSA